LRKFNYGKRVPKVRRKFHELELQLGDGSQDSQSALWDAFPKSLLAPGQVVSTGHATSLGAESLQQSWLATYCDEMLGRTNQVSAPRIAFDI